MGNCAEGLTVPWSAPSSSSSAAAALQVSPVPRTPKQGFKVCICGGSNQLGQSLCMLLAMDPLVRELAVQDLAITMTPPEGIGCDAHHIGRRCTVKAYALEAVQRPVVHLQECLTGCSLVIVCAGWPSNGRSARDLLKLNGNIAKNIVEACAKFCPEATVGIAMTSLNSLVPAMARLYEKAGLDPRRIVGITSLDVVRANKFVHVETGAPIESLSVPVVGGHSGPTAVPLFSQDRVAASISEGRQAELMRRVQDAGADVMEAKKGKCGATLSQAYACYRFAHAALNGLTGTRTQECCLVRSDVCEGLPYFASKVTFGRGGVEHVHPIGQVSQRESELLREAKAALLREVEIGLQYAEATELSKGAD